jgi:hypothetical protein
MCGVGMLWKRADEARETFSDARAWCRRDEYDGCARGGDGFVESTVLRETSLSETQEEEGSVAGVFFGERVEAVDEHRFGATGVAWDDAARYFWAEGR